MTESVGRHQGRLVAVLLPTALDPACNPGAKAPGRHSETSCELARLALAVWLTDPGWFEQFDAWLIEHIENSAQTPPARALAQALAHVENRLGKDELEAALADPRISEMLDVNGQVYARATYLGRRGVPRLIINGHPLPGLADPDHLDQLLEQAHPDFAAPQ